MPRRKRSVVRDIVPDAKHGDVLVTRFINYIMCDGEKSVVERSVYEAFEEIQKITKKDPLEIFKEAIDNVMPRIEVRSKRIGGATYQIPSAVSSRRGMSLALKWMVMSIKKTKGRKLSEKIRRALIEAVEKSGWAYKKREEVFKMAEANKAFAHYA